MPSPARTSPLLTSPPPQLGQDGAPVRQVAYLNDGPHRITATGLGGVLGESKALAEPGEDLEVFLPGTPQNPQTTPLDRRNGAQIATFGRHLSVIGGAISLSADYAGSTGMLAQRNRSLYVTGPGGVPGPTGVVHIEGVEVSGQNWETLNVRTAASAVVVVQNFKVTASLRPNGDVTSCPYKPLPIVGAGDHDGGDVGVQFMTTPRGLIMDGWIDERTFFQGPLFGKCEAGQRRPDFIRMANVASRDYCGNSWWLYLNPDESGELCPDVRLENVWMQPGFKRIVRTDGSMSTQTSVRPSLTGNILPAGGWTGADASARAALACQWWRTTDGSWPGSVREWSPDVPLPDELVLSGRPGWGYISPGYTSAQPVTS